MITKGALCLIVVGGASLLALGESTPKIAPVPASPLELVSGQTPVAATTANRGAILELLARARDNYSLRNARQGYDLKVRFHVDSQRQTDYDGAWELEDIFVPGQGLHWSAQSDAGYAFTGIASKGELYGEGTAPAVPLRLEEARGALLHPLPSEAYAKRESIRIATATYHGALVSCVLLSTSNKPLTTPGRAWEESEECIDPQSGLLQLHSEVPGRYAVYDYSNAPEFGGHVMPRTVTITEGDRVVSTITVEKLEEATAPEPKLFVATDAMRARGRTVEMGSMTKISRVHGRGPFTSAMTVHPVCIFGIVTPTGQLVEAHSLQPSDPNSQAALEDAKQIDFSSSTVPGKAPQQHFVFVIEKFISR